MKAAFLALPHCPVWQVSDLLRQLFERGWSIRTLTMDGQPVLTDTGLKIVSDGDVHRIFPQNFALLVVCGGTLGNGVLADPGVLRFLRQYDATNGIIGSIGEGTSLLAVAGLLGGLHIAVDRLCLESTPQAFTHSILEGQDTVRDGSIVTAKRNAGKTFAYEVMHLLEAYA